MLTTFALALAPYHPGPGGWGPGWGFWFVHALGWLLVIALIVTLIATRRHRGRPPFGAGPSGPAGGRIPNVHGAEAVLAERFARGDIDETEYRARLEVLRAQPPLTPEG